MVKMVWERKPVRLLLFKATRMMVCISICGAGLERETPAKFYHTDLVIKCMWGWGGVVKENLFKLTLRFLAWVTG